MDKTPASQPPSSKPTSSKPSSSKPLAGIRVLTLEQFGAGPYGTMFMAELGAEVIKVEAPDGDPSRQVGPHRLGKDDSEYFQAWNLGKKSVTIDLKSATGRRQFESLVKDADCVVNNMRGTQPARLGIDYASLRHIKPSIVCLHISAYGRHNERADWPGYDFLMQAEAGLMELTGDPDGAPTRVGVSLIDSMSGLTGTVGLLACLLRARTTGQGCDVDTCLYDVAIHQLTYPGTWYLNEGDVSPRVPRSAHLSLAPVQTFPTADGWIFIMCMTQKFWLELCKAVGRDDLLSDPRFPDPGTRARHRAALDQALDPTFKTRTTAQWLATFNGVLPAAPVYRLDQALDSAFAMATGMVSSVPHPAKGELRVISNPIRIDGERLDQRACSPLGADNETYLSEGGA
jgi:crotonobetainyl-CoA:carnitine CoA-transferase CaiB-like acyl-CoA transferase